MMDDLELPVPPFDPVQDALTSTGIAAVSTIPVLGPLAATALTEVVSRRYAQRQHDFDAAVGQAFARLFEQIKGLATREEIFDSDEFVAAVTRARRIAAESPSEQRRLRLAAAVANSGSWAPFSPAEREQFTRLVEDFGALHIWLLHFFTDPVAWLQANISDEQHRNISLGSIDAVLTSALGVPFDVWHDPVTQAVKDLESNGLASIPLMTTMTSQGVFASRTDPKGCRFLAFLNEPDSAAVEAPKL